jgi:hypothetical protein
MPGRAATSDVVRRDSALWHELFAVTAFFAAAQSRAEVRVALRRVVDIFVRGIGRGRVTALAGRRAG